MTLTRKEYLTRKVQKNITQICFLTLFIYNVCLGARVMRISFYSEDDGKLMGYFGEDRSENMQKVCSRGPENTGKNSISLLVKLNSGIESMFSWEIIYVLDGFGEKNVFFQ